MRISNVHKRVLSAFEASLAKGDDGNGGDLPDLIGNVAKAQARAADPAMAEGLGKVLASLQAMVVPPAVIAEEAAIPEIEEKARKGADADRPRLAVSDLYSGPTDDVSWGVILRPGDPRNKKGADLQGDIVTQPEIHKCITDLKKQIREGKLGMGIDHDGDIIDDLTMLGATELAKEVQVPEGKKIPKGTALIKFRHTGRTHEEIKAKKFGGTSLEADADRVPIEKSEHDVKHKTLGVIAALLDEAASESRRIGGDPIVKDIGNRLQEMREEVLGEIEDLDEQLDRGDISKDDSGILASATVKLAEGKAFLGQFLAYWQKRKTPPAKAVVADINELLGVMGELMPVVVGAMHDSGQRQPSATLSKDEETTLLSNAGQKINALSETFSSIGKFVYSLGAAGQSALAAVKKAHASLRKLMSDVQSALAAGVRAKSVTAKKAMEGDDVQHWTEVLGIMEMHRAMMQSLAKYWGTHTSLEGKAMGEAMTGLLESVDGFEKAIASQEQLPEETLTGDEDAQAPMDATEAAATGEEVAAEGADAFDYGRAPQSVSAQLTVGPDGKMRVKLSGRPSKIYRAQRKLSAWMQEAREQEQSNG